MAALWYSGLTPLTILAIGGSFVVFTQVHTYVRSIRTYAPASCMLYMAWRGLVYV